MAARKSCTHMTWAEAKANSGQGGGPGQSKKKVVKKAESHGKLLAAKIVAKNDTRKEEDIIQDRQAARRARKDMERQQQLALKREQEKEEAKLLEMVHPHEQAQQRMKDVAVQFQSKEDKDIENEQNKLDPSTDLVHVAECKQMQLDEILALEAIHAPEIMAEEEESSIFRISESCRLEELRDLIDQWQMDPDDKELLAQIAQHPPISFSLELAIDDDDGSSSNLSACLLLGVQFPPLYPLHGQQPLWDVVYWMLTDKTEKCSRNKPLEELGYIPMEEFQKALKEQAQHLLPDPCVYEITSTWLPENLYTYVTMNPIVNIIK